MRKHAQRPKTAELRQVYEIFLEKAEMDGRFRVRKTGEGPNKCSVLLYCNDELPFSFIVNTGEKVDYHLFYVRSPKPGQKRTLIKEFSRGSVKENPKGEITVEIRNSNDAEQMWRHVESFL